MPIKNLRSLLSLLARGGSLEESWSPSGFSSQSDASDAIESLIRSLGEADSIADTLRLIIDPGLVRFTSIDGKPASVMGIIPDPNYALRPRWHWYGDSDLVRVARLLLMRRRIPRLRGMFFGIRPEYRLLGLPALLAAELLDYILLHKHYAEVDASLMLEDNEAILKVIQAFGGEYYKKWRIYDLPLR